MKISAYILAPIGALLLALVVTGAGPASAQRGPAMWGSSWVLRPLPLPTERETRTAAIGELLFAQDLAPVAEARIDAELTVPLPGVLTDNLAEVKLTPETRLVHVSGGAGGARIFCGLHAVYRSRNPLDGRSLRLCLIDTDRDSRFDVATGAAARTNGPFLPMMLVGDVVVDVPYTLNTTALARLMPAGCAIRKAGSGFAIEFGVRTPRRVEFLAESGARRGRIPLVGGPPAADSILPGERMKFTTANLPLTFSYHGAVVELLAIEDRQVTYRVRNGFPTDEAMTLAFAGALPL